MRRGYGKRFNCIGRWTVPRQAVLDIFMNSRNHFTADEVYLRIKRTHPGIGIATVYRNLEFLRQQGLLSKFQFFEGKSHYELNDDEREHHHHLVCRNCGKVYDYSEFIERELSLMKDLEKELSEKHEFLIESHDLSFYGLCVKCRKK